MHLSSTHEARLALDALRRLVQGVRVGGQAVMSGYGLTGAQYFVLQTLAASPGVSIRELSERTLTDPSSVSVVVSRLVDKGLVTRAGDQADARRSVLSVSRKGTRLLEKSPQSFQARLIDVLRTQPPKRLKVLVEVLGQLNAELDSTAKVAPLFFEDKPERRPRRR